MSQSSLSDIVEGLLHASEKAATIARSCCGFDGETTEALLVAEKGEGEANSRFEKDFKTIADVLAQVCAKNEIARHCPEIANNVRGEERSEIGGITIELQECQDKTAELLSTLVSPDDARLMAKAAHCKTEIMIKSQIVPKNCPSIDPSDVGVWIDPIDATAEFIAGVHGKADTGKGLPCVTVLIGAYLKSTGEPIFGVINQPFYDPGQTLPLGRMIWGLCYGSTRKWGVSNQVTYPRSNTLLMSAAEDPQVITKIKDLGWDVDSVPGAGHKLLQVALGQAAGYILSKGTTFRWDTCGPHAILKARGGEILDYTTALPITYNDPDDQDVQAYCNAGGIIAYSDDPVFEKLKVIFDEK